MVQNGWIALYFINFFIELVIYLIKSVSLQINKKIGKMESKFESLTIFEFQERFPDVESCMKYLSDLKWGGGYVCSKCGHTRYCAGKQIYSRQCTRCCYVESVTSGTLFHKLKFSLLKAFYIVYYVSTNTLSLDHSSTLPHIS